MIELALIEKSLNQEFRSLFVWHDFFSMSSIPQNPSTPRAVRGMGPAIIVVLIICAALLGYYQMVYYPSIAVTSSTSSTSTVSLTPFNGTITILNGAPTAPRAQTYSPDVATVYLGYNSTVVWVNNDAAQHTISANSSDQSIDPNFYTWSQQPSGYNNIQPKGTPGDVLTYTFTVAGTYGYYCKYHPNMIGTIIVKPAPPGLTTSTGQTASTSIISTTTAIFAGISYVANEATLLAKSLATLIGSGIAP